ncbi:hypothetical protein NHX12_008674 [Muraenolepis orangiensis]|uniref:Uncharacterized protein n=1 Tax=Muraenolepis orangiensis TaxID=630683 RepID=A0A9Q0IA16_9TELE|nr:hypothetical protein NHX12_008674 [Muraenolepis orangiensis]
MRMFSLSVGHTLPADPGPVGYLADPAEVVPCPGKRGEQMAGETANSLSVRPSTGDGAWQPYNTDEEAAAKVCPQVVARWVPRGDRRWWRTKGREEKQRQQ